MIKILLNKETVENWDDKDSVKQRKKFAKDFSNITSIDKRRAN